MGELPAPEFAAQLGGEGVVFRAGRFSVRLLSPLASVAEGVHSLYADSDTLAPAFADFTVRVQPASGLRRWYRPQALFSLNGALPFAPLPLAHAYPLLEWGLNWCVSTHCHQYLIVHAAVVEKHGQALILPGTPGAGKSTLCALLTGRGGWRLLSDELALIDLASGLLHPNPRPISLKNASIGIVQRTVADAVLSPAVADTLKGTVAHMRPPPGSMVRVLEPAVPALIVFPRFIDGVEGKLAPLPRGEAFMRMADNSFNYSILGAEAFRVLAALVDQSRCFDFPNGGDAAEAIATMDALVQS
ncbi:MAG: HprK-related kinase A [Haliea sp.]|uniref:HprK-related kinase A n=1 Tax=Haliea sp. TaxID=1932666 RepID=UPI0032EFE5CB